MLSGCEYESIDKIRLSRFYVKDGVATYSPNGATHYILWRKQNPDERLIIKEWNPLIQRAE